MSNWKHEQVKEDCFTLILIMATIGTTTLIGKMILEVLKF
jgi:hypothetical protein